MSPALELAISNATAGIPHWMRKEFEARLRELVVAILAERDEAGPV